MSAPRRFGLLPIMLLILGGVVMSPVALSQVIDRYEYKPDAIYQVRTGLGITTQIELSANEKILDYSTGFSGGWDLSRRGNVFYLKPKNVDVDTNMMVRTETHSYIFELKVVATDWRALDQARAAGVQYKISFLYSPEAQFSSVASGQAPDKSAPVEPPAQLETGIDKGRRYYYDYSYATRSKAQWLIPSTVYDDGRFTYIKMNDGISFPSGNFPTVYGRQEAHGEDFVVNTTVEKNIIVVHGTYPYLVVRHGLNVLGLRRNEQK